MCAKPNLNAVKIIKTNYSEKKNWMNFGFILINSFIDCISCNKKSGEFQKVEEPKCVLKIELCKFKNILIKNRNHELAIKYQKKFQFSKVPNFCKVNINFFAKTEWTPVKTDQNQK